MQSHVAKRERELNDALMPAGEIYSGEQHVRLMRGVRKFREAADGNGARLDSAHSLGWLRDIGEDRHVAPYECTFATMKTKELADWAKALQCAGRLSEIGRAGL